MSFLIPLMILSPLAAALLLLLLRSTPGLQPRWVALWASIATLLISLAVASHYDAAGPSGESGPIQPKLTWRHTWLTFETPAPGAGEFGHHLERTRLEFYLGIDGISLVLVVLTTLLTVCSVLVSWDSIQDRAADFYACLLVLETGLIGVFCAFDVVLFYVFFEFTLVPLFFLVGIWGGPQRRYAAFKFFMYTLAGSVVSLIGLVALAWNALQTGALATPFSLPDVARVLAAGPLEPALQWWLFLALSAGFMIKVPLFPFHTWLPLAHVEAPTAGSVMLAGVLLKLGTYGFLRLSLPLLPHASLHLGVPLIGTLAVIGIIYGALCSLAQDDIKKLVAYSSISHLGFCMLGMFALNSEGITGSVLQMVNHGLSTGALFLLVGMIYERYHTRQLVHLSGLATRLPWLTCFMVFICLSSIGLPGLNGFVGEVLALIGMFKARAVYAVFGATGVVLGAWYLLTLVQSVFFGPLREPSGLHGPVPDLRLREVAALAPIAGLCLWIGVYPETILKTIRPNVEAVVRLYDDADDWQRTDTPPAPRDERLVKEFR